MSSRYLLLLTFAAGLSQVPIYAQPEAAIPSGCVAAISSEEFQKLPPQEQRKYRRVGAGANRGRYAPRYYELVGGSGPCAGFYANPCGHDRYSTELVDGNSCGMLQSIARSKKLRSVRSTEEQAQAAMSPKNKKKLEKIGEGPDTGKYKPKYYERTKEGLWASPCGHDGRSTELVEANACSEIQSLVRLAR
ncbi:MAG: hypothetical protein IT161_22130 [Bryobacterales bacterium]|nr:hypothetical protein [Bryobacterales bacterium]